MRRLGFRAGPHRAPLRLRAARRQGRRIARRQHQGFAARPRSPPARRSDWNETAPYAEAVEISHRLERASRFVKVLDIGTTPEGRTMIALVVSKDRAFTPEAAAKTGKAVIMIQSGIHAGEIEGKDTVLMLVRDMTVEQALRRLAGPRHLRHHPGLQRGRPRILQPLPPPQPERPADPPACAPPRSASISIAITSRPTRRKCAPGCSIFNTWMPDFLIDNHVTDGSDMQYDVTWDMARNQDIAEPAGAWVRDKFVPELDKRMAADGHMVAPYGALRNVNGKREFFMEVFSPRYSHLYSAVQNRPSLLVETPQPEDRQNARLGQLRHHAPHHRHHPARSRRSAPRRPRGRPARWPRAPATAPRRPSIWPAKSATRAARWSITR